MIKQLKQRGFYPLKEKDVLLRLGEEMGEIFAAIREKQPKVNFSREIADVLWVLLILCDIRKIDLEKALLEKYKYNEKRPLSK